MARAFAHRATEILIPLRSERTSTMVPGMTERERLIRNTQRIEWLCDAAIGPARSSGRRPERGSRRSAACPSARIAAAVGPLLAQRLARSERDGRPRGGHELPSHEEREGASVGLPGMQ
jgi:hypothetical protein